MDPLESSRRKLARAVKHLNDLNAAVVSFIQGDPYAPFVEPNSENSEEVVHKIKLIKPLPLT